MRRACLTNQFDTLASWYTNLTNSAPEVVNWLDAHLVIKVGQDGGDYPINLLRNVALDYTTHRWCFIVDADALPCYTEREYARDLDSSVEYIKRQRHIKNDADKFLQKTIFIGKNI